MLGKITLYKNRVVIYYSHQGVLRYSTGITLDIKTHLTKDGVISRVVSDYNSKNQIIQNKLEQVNKILRDYHHLHNSPPPVLYVKNKLQNPPSTDKPSSEFLPVYEKFLEEKRKFFSEKNRSISSLKDYVSFKNSIKDFQSYKNKTLYINEIDKNTLSEYKRFLETPREKEKGYITKGGLNQNTIIKRFSCLKSFYSTLEEWEVLPVPIQIKSFKISSEPVEIISLSMDEVRKLNQVRLTGTKKKIRDTFIFSCLSGLRWSDLTTINKTLIKKEGDIFYIEKISVKTKVLVKIPLTDWGLEFLKTMDYKLDFMTNQKFNEGLKEICEGSGLFNDLTRSEDDEGELVPRWKMISIHKGRHTFISNLVKLTVPINEIMKYTGHKKLETLMKYINTQTPMTNEYVKKLDLL